MPRVSLHAWRSSAARGLVGLFVASLLATGLAADAVTAADLTDEISTNRRSQLYSESVMRQADRALERLKRQQKATHKKVKRAKRSIKASRQRFANAGRIVRTRAERLADAEARFAEVEEDEEVEDLEAWKERLRGLRRDLRVAKARRQSLGVRLRTTIRSRNARKRSLASIRRQRRATIARRDSAAGALAARIVQMTRLAQLRAQNQTTVSLAADGSTFAWPSTGRISQGYGCTGLRWNPRRGSCRHFHDGLDIVSGYGSPVRAAAVGVVAYVGWNPWDERGRAFIVVIGHPEGFVTRYGHLLPARKVRVGQLVRKGEAIGKMGNTGFSTGTHLHFELLRGTTPQDPTAYLPPGVVRAGKSSPPASAKKAGAKKAGAKKERGVRERPGKAGEGGSASKRSGARDDRRRTSERNAQDQAPGRHATEMALDAPSEPSLAAVVPCDDQALGADGLGVPESEVDEADAEVSAGARTSWPAPFCRRQPTAADPVDTRQRAIATPAPSAAPSTSQARPIDPVGVELSRRGTSPAPQ